MITILTTSIFTLLVLLCGTLAIPRPLSDATAADPCAGDLRFVAGTIVTILLLLNASLWTPVAALYPALVVVSSVAVIRLYVLRGLALRVLPQLSAVVVSVFLATCVIYFRVDGGDEWLMEAANHDSIFYFQGASWAWTKPLLVGPEQVSAAWHLGNCSQGAIFIGTDCVAYRAGTYALLGAAQASTVPASGNSAQIAAGLVVIFPAMALGLMAKSEVPAEEKTRRSVLRAVALTAPLALAVFMSHGITSALVNANVATAFGAACLAMLLGLACLNSNAPYFKAAILGMGAALAGHVYGEAALPAGFIAAVGVVADAVRSRRPVFFLTGGLVSLTFFLASLNVVAVELVESFTQISAIAVGGQWPSWYLDQWPGYWIVAPYSGILLGADPTVTIQALVVGAAILVLTVALAAANRDLLVPIIGLGLLSVVLIGYLEARDYAYGEHKVLQLLGAPAFMLSAACIIELSQRRGIHWRRWMVAAGVLVAVSCLDYARRVDKLIEDWEPSHGLSGEFSAMLDPVSEGDVLILDDQGSLGVEKFQKAHYLGFLVHERGARMVMPKMDGDNLRGGYLRGVVGNSLATAPRPNWLLQLHSESGVGSMVSYADGVEEGPEYRLVDLSRVPGAAVAADGWFTCEGSHCWTLDGFEIETVVTSGCPAGQAVLSIQAGFFAPPEGAKVSLQSEAGAQATFSAEGYQHLKLPLRTGWDRVIVRAGWKTTSPAELGQSTDGRKLFSKVTGVSVTCDPAPIGGAGAAGTKK